METNVPFDWQAINRFTARNDARFVEGEDGEPWTPAPAAMPEILIEDEAEIRS